MCHFEDPPKGYFLSGRELEHWLKTHTHSFLMSRGCHQSIPDSFLLGSEVIFGLHRLSKMVLISPWNNTHFPFVNTGAGDRNSWLPHGQHAKSQSKAFEADCGGDVWGKWATLQLRSNVLFSGCLECWIKPARKPWPLMNHFHNIPGINPKKAIAVSQQDVCLYRVKRGLLIFPVSNWGRFGVRWPVTEV